MITISFLARGEVEYIPIIPLQFGQICIQSLKESKHVVRKLNKKHPQIQKIAQIHPRLLILLSTIVSIVALQVMHLAIVGYFVISGCIDIGMDVWSFSMLKDRSSRSSRFLKVFIATLLVDSLELAGQSIVF